MQKQCSGILAAGEYEVKRLTRYTVYHGAMQGIEENGKTTWRFLPNGKSKSFADKRDALVYFAECKNTLRSDFLMEGMRRGNFGKQMQGAGLGIELRGETFEVPYLGEEAQDAVSSMRCAGWEVLHAASYTYDTWRKEFGNEE